MCAVKMLGLLKRYHAYLISETESLGPQTRWAQIHRYTFPWFLPLIAVGVLCWVLNLDERGREVLVIPVAVICLGGILYVGFVLLFFGIQADSRRARAAKSQGG